MRGATTLWGSTFIGAPTFDRWLALQLHRWGVMGTGTRAVLQRLICPGMQVADVGANQGIFTLLMSQLVGDSGRVIALEPDPVLASTLRRNIAASSRSNVTLIEAGADARAGQATLYHSGYNAGDNRMAQGELSKAAATPVRVVRLDDVIPNGRLDFVKIDTQGWEVNVLQGMSGCMAKNPSVTILFELWPYGLQQAGRQPFEPIMMLMDLGFEVRTLDGGVLTPHEATAFAARLKGRRYTDLIAARRHPRGRTT